MKIDWLEYEGKEHVLSWFLCEAMSEAGIEKFGEFDSSALDVVLTINGVEVPIVKSMDFLQSQLDAINKEGQASGHKKAVSELRSKMVQWIEENPND